MVSIAIPFVRTESSQNPNVKMREEGDPAEPYFRAMTVAFASLRRWNPDCGLEYISNQQPPAVYAEHFRRLGVSFVHADFSHRPPPGFAARFTASLYLLDALRALTADTTIIVDPDILCIAPLDAILEDSKHKVGALAMNYDKDHDINGLTRQGAGHLHGLLGESIAAPIHYGGEVYVIPLEHIETILRRSDEAWKLSLSRHLTNESKFTTEEHILSYVFRGVPVHELNKYARRIWTSHRHRRVDGAEKHLILWHLPAEKDRGFARLFPNVINYDSWFWTACQESFVAKSGKAMGFHHRDVAWFAKDLIGSNMARFQKYFSLLHR